MQEAVGPNYSQVPPQNPGNDNGHLETGGKPAPRGNCKKCTIALSVALVLVSSALLITTVLAVQRCKCPSAGLGPPAGPACPDGWIGYRGKCYYFSEVEGDWVSSQNHCSSLSAFLSGMDTRQDMDFMVRHKGKFEHWIGLRRDPGQPWKWANSTEFNNLFPIAGDGDCAYLNDQGKVSSSRCADQRYWICSTPDALTKAKEAAVEAGS